MSQVVEAGIKAAEQGYAAKHRGDIRLALEHYTSAVQNFNAALSSGCEDGMCRTLRAKIAEFERAIAELRPQCSTGSRVGCADGAALDLPDAPLAPPQVACLSTAQLAMQRGSFADDAAQRAERSGRASEAVGYYDRAAGEYLAVLKTSAPNEQLEAKQRLSRVLDRLEALKLGTRSHNKGAAQVATPSPNPAALATAGTAATACAAGTGTPLSAAERDVLARSSYINGRVFLPWEDDNRTECFAFPTDKPFSDPEAPRGLTLSPAQKRHAHEWVRAAEFVRRRGGGVRATPTMIKQVRPELVKQTLIADCSFVSALCIAANYEQRFRKQLITRIIFPQDEHGVPRYNPGGKYLVKLWWNGVARKVVIDDQIPVRKSDGEPLCSYSTLPSELWVTIVEKAYMKLHGGYDFPGGNSEVELYALTGWIPESLRFKDVGDGGGSGNAAATDIESCWSKLHSAANFGDCLVTMYTGTISDAEEDRLGLVGDHAYAVLQVHEVQGVRLILVKNPWSSKRWRGAYSCDDEARWTPALRQQLKYNPADERKADNGIFFIDFDSARHHFKGLTFNWNPELMQHRCARHHYWPLSQGPKDDRFNVGYNPQFTLTVKVPAARHVGTGHSFVANVWLLLTRHTTRKRAGNDGPVALSDGSYALTTDGSGAKSMPLDEPSLALHAYSRRNGHRVYHPDEKVHRVRYTDSTQILEKLDLPAGTHKLTLVVSQFAKEQDVDFTLAAYATAPIDLVPTPMSLLRAPRKPYIVIGEWSASTAVGIQPGTNYECNPQYALTIPVDTVLHLRLEAPKDFAIGIRLFNAPSNSTKGKLPKRVVSNRDAVLSSGKFRYGLTYLEAGLNTPDADMKRPLACGVYVIVVSTFEPGQQGPFRLIAEVPCSGARLEPLPLPQPGFVDSEDVPR